MGISGLLPLLKSIQVQKHLSEFKGKTLAVDGYVWLHRGTFACATELATGKHTIKYVDYFMQKVRLLRHYGISPYIVFDGGPLPAKRGTEGERKHRREENKSKGDKLAQQGRHKEAREYYCKCIDVTPQMAYQVIKALKAERIDYVVAPYEADAQLAFLERNGIVSAIISEDSDLLVYGCRQVLYKLDATTATITSICRDDFGSVAGIRGWSDAQFRAMAILAGCDYLPSVPGVAIKTANTLLRKHRTLDGAVRALRLEARYSVPRGYLEAVYLAERVFLHQRVYDPVRCKLVHLLPVPDGSPWTDIDNANVGEDFDPELAKAIARGDACPVDRVPMTDINPSYKPRETRPLPLESHNTRAMSEKGKKKTVTMLNFLVPRSPAQPSLRKLASSRSIPSLGTSGKRTLVDAMNADETVKRARREHHKGTHNSASRDPKCNQNVPPGREDHLRSRFFGGAAGPSRRHSAPIPDSSRRSEEDDGPDEIIDVDCAIEQEDGYLSPGPSFARCVTPDLSSPARPGSVSTVRARLRDGDDGVLSSPERAHGSRLRKHGSDGRGRPRSESPLGNRGTVGARVLAPDTPEHPGRTIGISRTGSDEDIFTLDLFDSPSNDLDGVVGTPYPTDSSGSSTPPGPSTPQDHGRTLTSDIIDIDAEFELEDIEVEEANTGRQRNAVVARAWWAKFARSPGSIPRPGIRPNTPVNHDKPRLQRHETTANMDGTHRAFRFRQSNSSKKQGVRKFDSRGERG